MFKSIITGVVCLTQHYFRSTVSRSSYLEAEIPTYVTEGGGKNDGFDEAGNASVQAEGVCDQNGGESGLAFGSIALLPELRNHVSDRHSSDCDGSASQNDLCAHAGCAGCEARSPAAVGVCRRPAVADRAGRASCSDPPEARKSSLIFFSASRGRFLNEFCDRFEIKIVVRCTG